MTPLLSFLLMRSASITAPPAGSFRLAASFVAPNRIGIRAAAIDCFDGAGTRSFVTIGTSEDLVQIQSVGNVVVSSGTRYLSFGDTRLRVASMEGRGFLVEPGTPVSLYVDRAGISIGALKYTGISALVHYFLA